jgi:hypothetical protein
MGIRTGNRTAIRTRVDARYSYRTDNRIPIRFAANRTLIRTGNRIRVDPLLDVQLISASVDEPFYYCELQIIPTWKKMIADCNADISLNFCDLYYSEFNEDVEKGSIIAMQDANTFGYTGAINKKKGLNPDHVRLTLSELAKYHACGYAYMKSFPGGIKQGLEAHKVSIN